MSVRMRRARDLAAIVIAVAIGILVTGYVGEGFVLMGLGLLLWAGAWAWGRRAEGNEKRAAARSTRRSS